MRVLFVGGPMAGRLMDWPEPLPPTICFPITHQHRGWEEAGIPDTSEIEPSNMIYGQGVAARRIAGVPVRGYHYRGEDPYRAARTLERMVEFCPPRSLQDLEDKAAIEFLIWESAR